MARGTTNDTETSSKDSDAPDRCDISYRNPQALREAYEAADGSIQATSKRFDASYCTVRNYLIEYEIHDPQERPDMSLAAQLEAASPDDVGGAEGGTENVV